LNRRHQADSDIPRYGLYGESAMDETDFVHIEDIETRSAKNDWLIKPHRHHGMFQMLYLQQGEAEVFVDDAVLQATDNWVFTLPVGSIHGFRFSPGTKGKVLTLSETFINTGLLQSDQQDMQTILLEAQQIPLEAAREVVFQMDHCMTWLEGEISAERPARKLMLERQLGVLLVLVLREYLKSAISQDISRSGELASAFRKLLDDRVLDQWRVDDYAMALNISVSTLNRYCHDWFGESSKRCIQQRLLREMKRKLVYSSESLEKIAWSLGFVDASYFSRVFRKLTGSTPKAYRNQKSIVQY